MIACIDDFNLYFKKQYKSEGNDTKFYLKLCYPVIVNLQNHCPKLPISYKVKKCFTINSIIFELDEKEKIEYKYKNLTNDVEAHVSSYVFININTSTIEHCNNICMMELCIPVIPNCFSKDFLDKCVPLTKIGTWVNVDEVKDDCNECVNFL